MMKNFKKKKGFTLIELIIVIAILGILAAIAIPKFGNVQKDARIKADIASAKTVADTAAMLIASEKIKINTADATASKDVGGYDTDIELGAVGGSGYLIAQALQKVPTPQATGAKFIVGIETNTGNITVYVDSVSNDKQVYPKPTGTVLVTGANVYYPDLAVATP